MVVGFLYVITFLIGSGVFYQFVSTKLDNSKYPPLGKMVDIGGYKLHINSTGTGGPTVVLDAGTGCSSLDWALVQPEISKFTRVCSYDRAGNGWSEESPLVRTSQNIVDELHTLLKNAGISGPYILVGHSSGGINALLYSSRYPDEVVGVVLVDSSHEDQLQRFPPEPKSLLGKIVRSRKFSLFLAYIGFLRLACPLARKRIEMFPEHIQDMYLAKSVTPKFIRLCFEEISKFEESLKQLKSAGNFLDEKPLIVITAGKVFEELGGLYSQEYVAEMNKVWKVLQKELVTKSAKGKQLIAERSNHMITHQQPDIVVEAVREIVNTIAALQ